MREKRFRRRKRGRKWLKRGKNGAIRVKMGKNVVYFTPNFLNIYNQGGGGEVSLITLSLTGT